MRRLALIAGSKETRDALKRQLENFLPESIDLQVHSFDEGLRPLDSVDLIVYSSEALYDEVSSIAKGAEEIPYIIGNRTINYDALEQIVSIPQNTPVLLVNDLYESADEVRQALVDLGLVHMDLTLYYPGCDVDVSKMVYAITPGEVSRVPEGIETVVDIGSRIFDFKTIARILSHLNLLEESSTSFSKMYLEKIIKVARSLAESRAQIQELNDGLDRVIDGFEEGLVIFDAHEKVVLFNDMLKKIFKMPQYKFVEGSLAHILHNKELLRFLRKEDTNGTMELLIDGNEYLVTKFGINQSALTCASFKSLKGHHKRNALKKEAIRKGHVAKYALNDIVGDSTNINALKDLIRKLSKTDMTILIHGESGTGKELTASAIHNESDRSDAPFLAVNFSALPDELIESELFGYEEGAFTGAKKGGKKGLFEEANGGTIFLDEIGDVSLKVQSRLLRVLEEKEIMRVGGNEIRPVDVRIIAATNKDLPKMVENQLFREDLYFRLKMGYLYLEPLRNRPDDIPILLDHLAQNMSSKKVEFHPELIEKLCAYEWRGNIRELKNTVNYMLAVRKDSVLTVLDLPDQTFFGLSGPVLDFTENQFSLPEDQMVFLRMIHEMKRGDERLTRLTLAQKSMETPFKRSENQVRRILLSLKDQGYIVLNKGRNGIELTQQGRKIVNKQSRLNKVE